MKLRDHPKFPKERVAVEGEYEESNYITAGYNECLKELGNLEILEEGKQ